MSARANCLKFVVAALLVGVGLGVASHYSDAILVKISITIPLAAASVVDPGWIMSGSTKGDVAFWLTLLVQWAVLGWLLSVLWVWISRKQKRT